MLPDLPSGHEFPTITPSIVEARMKSRLLLLALIAVSGAVCAAPVTYTADPDQIGRAHV